MTDKITVELRNDKIFVRLPKYIPFLQDITFWKFVKMVHYEQDFRDSKLYSAFELRNGGEYGYDFFGLRHALRYFELHGYKVVIDPAVSPIIYPSKVSNIVKPFDRSFELYPFQEKDVNNFFGQHRTGIILGHQPGLGKTMIAAEIIRREIVNGLQTKVLWVVPKGDLTYQLQGEMREKFNVDVEVVTGETHRPRDRCGGDPEDSVYHQYPFITTTWGIFRKDLKNAFDRFFDIPIFLVLDEVHVVSEWGLGINRNVVYKPNVSFQMARKAPFLRRIGLTGTPMPNGHWWELFSIVDAINPAGIPSTRYFKRMLDTKQKRIKEQGDDGLKERLQKAEEDVRDFRLEILNTNMIRHTKKEVADQLPAVVDVKFTVELRDEESKIYGILKSIFLDFIDNKIPSIQMTDDWGRVTDEGILYNSIRHLLWQVMRIYSSYGTKYMESFLERSRAQEKTVYEVINQFYGSNINKIERLLRKRKVRPIPKNESVLDWCEKYIDHRGVIFINRVDTVIELAKVLHNIGLSTKVVLGKGNTLSQSDAQMFGQSTRFTDETIGDVKRWFWFPWSKFHHFITNPSLQFQMMCNGSEVTGTPSDLQMTAWDEPITIRISWTSPIPRSVQDELTAFFSNLDRWRYYELTFSDTPDFTTKSGSIVISAIPYPDLMREDRRVLVCSDVLMEGVNMQIAETVIFFDQVFSIRQREQRLSRIHRLASKHHHITLVSVLCGLEHSIAKALQEKYKSIKGIDRSPVTQKDIRKYL